MRPCETGWGRSIVSNYDLQVVVEDNGVPVVDFQRLLPYAEPQFSTKAPGGYDRCSFRLMPRDVLASQQIAKYQTVKIYNGLRLVYRGVIRDFRPVIGSDDYIDVDAYGERLYAEAVTLRKVWYDDAVLAAAYEKDINKNPDNYRVVVSRSPEYLLVRLAVEDSSSNRSTSDRYSLYYDAIGGNVRTVGGSGEYRTGEGVRLRIFNVNAGTAFYDFADDEASPASITLSHSAVTATCTTIEFRIGPEQTSAGYTNTDYINLVDLTVTTNYHSSHSVNPATTNPNHTSSELIEDGLWITDLAGSKISSSMSNVTAQGITFRPFGSPRNISMTDLLDKITAYGDGSYNAYYWYIGYDSDSSNLPMVRVEQRSTASANWVVRAGADNVQSLDISLSDDRRHNYIIVEYTDDRGKTVQRTPADNASLKNTASISASYRRDRVIQVDTSDSTEADQIGIAYLTANKNGLYKGSIAIQWYIEQYGSGARVPASWVRAGDVVYLPDVDGGVNIFVGSTSYDAANGRLTITPDVPPDTLESIMAQRELVFVKK